MSAENKKKLFRATFEVLWIFAIIVLLYVLFPGAPTWPVFFVGLIFSMYGEKKPLGEVLLHGFTGLMTAFVYYLCVKIINVETSLLPFALWLVLPALALILYGCFFLPKVFSVVSFAFFTLALIEASCLEHFPLMLALMLVVGPVQVLVSRFVTGVINKLFERK